MLQYVIMSKNIISLQARSLAKLSPGTISQLPSPIVREGKAELAKLDTLRKKNLTNLTRKKLRKNRGKFYKEGRFMTTGAMKRTVLGELDDLIRDGDENVNVYLRIMPNLMNLLLNALTPDNLRGEGMSQLRYLLVNNTLRRDDLIAHYDNIAGMGLNYFDGPRGPVMNPDEVPGRYPSYAQRVSEITSLRGNLGRAGNKKKTNKRKKQQN